MENLPFPQAANAGAMSTMTDAELYAQMGDASKAAKAGKNYLKFVNGVWTFGREGDELEEDDRCIVNPRSFVKYWQGWEDGVAQIYGEEVPLFGGTLAPESDLPELKKGDNNGWSKCVACTFHFYGEEVDETPLFYGTSTKGGKDCIMALFGDMSAGFKAHPDAAIPILQFSGDSYKNKNHGGRTAIPVLNVTGWVNGENGEEVKELSAE